MTEIYTTYEDDNKKKPKTKLGKLVKRAFSYNHGARKRIWELDILRGILMIFVTIDHCCTFGLSLGIFDFNTAFGEMIRDGIVEYTRSAFRVGIQPFGLFLFSYLSGMSCSFTKSSVKRVIKMVSFCAFFMGGYAILHLINPDFFIASLMFNIIAVVTISVVFWAILDLIKCPTWVRLGLSILIICVGLTFYFMYFTRDFAYINNDIMALLVYNKHGFQLSPQNFEPLFPHMGWFMLGGIMGKYIYRERKTLTKHEQPFKAFIPVAYVGKHSLVVYMIGTVLVLALVLGIRELVALFL